jgi:hypothetical protein
LLFETSTLFAAVFRLSRCIDSRRINLDSNFARFAKGKKRARAAPYDARMPKTHTTRRDGARLTVAA